MNSNEPLPNLRIRRQSRPSPAAVRRALEEAQAAVRKASLLRRHHRRHTLPERQAQLKAAKVRISAAAKPLGSWLMMARWDAAFEARHGDLLREASAALARERRKLNKMLRVR